MVKRKMNKWLRELTWAIGSLSPTSKEFQVTVGELDAYEQVSYNGPT